MTHLQKQIQAAQHRLWLNRWLLSTGWCIAIGSAAFGLVVLVQRLFDWPIPLAACGLAFGAASLIGSVAWTLIRREDAEFAAAKLDEAAGLRERVSSGSYCLDADDPFARAVVIDAERVCTSISARKHIRLSAPRSLPPAAGAMIVASLMLLITPGLLKPAEQVEAAQQEIQVEQAKIAVKRKLADVRHLMETTPVLADLKDEAGELDSQSGGELHRAKDIRHEAIKKIEQLADAVKKKRESPHYDSVRAMRKMMRGLKVPHPSTAPTHKLSKALQRGDFKTAREEIAALREQLATLKSEEDQASVMKLSRELDELAKRLAQLAQGKKLAEELAKAGLTKEDIERLLRNLKKKDIEELKEKLARQGMNARQIEKIARQLRQQQQAGAIARKLAQGMKQGAQGAQSGQMGNAMSGLSMAADQLSELEQLEQEMNQLDSTMVDLQNAKDDLDKPCSSCGGGGCGRCKGQGTSGRGMGKLGRGRGGLAPEQQTSIGFKIERGKVHTGKGAIIGQFLVDGEQVKGDVASGLSEVVSAAERDASDRISRDRVPRQYQKAVKSYFSNVQRLVGGDTSGANRASTPAESATPTGADAERD